MSPEIASLLDELGVAPPAVEVEPEEFVDPSMPESPTALRLDSWGIRKGNEVLHETERLRELFGVPTVHQEGLTFIVAAGQPSLSPESPESLTVSDLFNAAFQTSPRLAENCASKERGEFVRQLLETPEFQALRTHTVMNELTARIATVDLSSRWMKLATSKSNPDPLEVMAAAGDAITDAEESVKSAEDAMSALGMGGDGAVAGKSFNAGKLQELFKSVRNNETLRRIMELAGRYRRCGAALQRRKTLHGMDDMVGVVLDGDPGRLLPSELALLGDPDLEDDLLRRIAENSCMCREYHGIERVARGPIVVVVDESGSMGGEPIANAKAFALAMSWIARHQSRWVALIGYSGGCPPTTAVMAPGSWDQELLIEWLEHFYSGGSCRDVPIKELPEIWPSLGCPKGKTDVIFLTDAICSLPSDMVQQFNSWRKSEKARCIGLIIGQRPGDLSLVCDRTYTMPRIGIEEEGIVEALSA
jgi:uncharacterized protein with von Willebrand factor type A (vWA) domain